MTRQEIIKRVSDGVSSTTFLTGVGVTGTITTAFFTGRASFKAAEIIQRERERMQNDPQLPRFEPTTKEKVELVWPLYIAPVSVGVTTITAILMANHEASKKVAALTVASGISERALVEYKNKVAEKLSGTKATDIRDEIAQDRIKNQPPTTTQVMMVGDSDVLCYDMLTGRYFKSNVEDLRKAMNDVNYELISHDYASLSFFYEKVGLTATAYSDLVGWRADDHPELQFSTVMSPDDQPCIAIDFDVPPHPEYNRLY